VRDLETSRIGAPYIYDISHLRVNPSEPQRSSVTVTEGGSALRKLSGS